MAETAKLTAVQKLKFLILARAAELSDHPALDFAANTGEYIEASFEVLRDSDEYWDAKSEVRGGEVETDIEADWSRHYESKSVAAKLPDGSWIGWTYWYGGGKHGEPEAVEWISEAYDLNCTEEERVVTVRTFEKAGA